MLTFLALALLIREAPEIDFKGSVQTRWRERLESGHRFSGFEWAGNGLIRASFQRRYSGLLEISSWTTPSLTHQEFVSASEGQGSRSLSLTQAALGIYQELNSIRFTALLGRFRLLNNPSPLLFGMDQPIEGAEESIEIPFNTRHEFGLTGTQMAIEQSLNTQNQWLRRWMLRWLATYSIDWDGLKTKFFIQHFWISSLSDLIKTQSASRGNSFSGSLINPRLNAQFQPSELGFEITSNPLGIATSLTASLAVNWKTPDKARGYFVEGKVGNTWLAKHLQVVVGYYYSEPDLMAGDFVDHRYGFTNRESFLGKADYFLTNDLRLGVVYLYGRQLSNHPLQGNLKELEFVGELKF